MATKKKMLQAAAGNAGGAALNVEDVFSTYLYDGNGSTQTITNGIDLDGEGGLVWVKDRNDTYGHYLTDTERGAGSSLSSHNTQEAYAPSPTQPKDLYSFNSDGFSVAPPYNSYVNQSSVNHVSWTFRKAPKFFDVVEFTTPSSGNTDYRISHSLNTTVGTIIVKSLDISDEWYVYHRGTSSPNATVMRLNGTYAEWNTAAWGTGPSSSDFGVSTALFGTNRRHIAYLFAHNDGDGEFGPDGDADIIKCGSYTGNGSTDGPEIDLGFEPQWVLIKRTDATGGWNMYDNMRGVATGGNDAILYADLSIAEINSVDILSFNSVGFKLTATGSEVNDSGGNYIYIAIRRGTKVPESGTEVFAVDLDGTSLSNGVAFNSGWPVDLALLKGRSDSSNGWFAHSRLQGAGNYLQPNDTLAEAGGVSNATFDHMDGWFKATITGFSSWMWKRAPNFFDVVAYTGNGTAGRTVSHNLGVAPEMMWVKKRNNARDWKVYHSAVGNGIALELNATGTGADSPAFWNDTTPAEGSFTVGTSDTVNGSGDTFIAYLFASLDGVSKVGSYTGNGSSQTIDCGFTSGARFVLIKRTNGAGSWRVYDTERGIVSGYDPILQLNTTDAEYLFDDGVDPHSSGFSLDSNAIYTNANGDSYIFYAIA